jgi:hypothetical protein
MCSRYRTSSIAGAAVLAWSVACGSNQPTHGTGGAAAMGPIAGGGGTGGSSGTRSGCTASPEGPVTFSTPSGLFQGSITVTLGTAEAGVEIRYTVNRTPPTAASMLYAAPLTFSTTTELRAQAFVGGAGVGKAQAAIYVARNFDQSHDLPVLVLDSYGVALPAPTGGLGMVNKDFVDVAVLGLEPSGGTVSLSSSPTLASPAGFHLRGQSSASFEKRPYRVELREADGTDRNCEVLGMPREADWVLHPPFPDKALIRNAFVYSLGPAVGLAAPRARFAEVYVNSATRPLEASDYQGVYLVVETIKNQKDRLNLQQLETTDAALPAISGGYVFKFEWRVTDIEQELPCPAGTTSCWTSLEVADPKPWIPAQEAWLAGHLGMFANALHSAAPADAVTGYPAYIDVPSFVNHVIVNELTRNMDAYSRSQYFYKDRDSKIFAGPLWDFDLTAGVGTSGTYANLETSGWQYESNDTRIRETADWFPILLADPTFRAALVARWKELRGGPLSDAELSARISALTAGLQAAATRNFQKWPNLSTARVSFFTPPSADSWQGQVDVMRTWLLARATWLDTAWR